ncbi:MAG: hypothetical protein ACRELF_28920, partial [Gemmataceae bacterium]
YLGWYKVRSQPASVPGKHNVEVEINTKEIATDLQKGAARVEHLLNKNESKSPGGLTLPSASSGNPNKPLFPFHSDNNGATPISGPLSDHPLMQFGARK